MRHLVGVCLTLLATTVLTAPAGARSEATPGAETILTAANAAQYRNALTALSAVTTGTNTLRLSADITLTANTEPTYTGTQPLTVNGQGHTIDGNVLNRVVDASGSTAGLTIRNLTVVDANSEGGNGGAVVSGGALAVRDSSFAQVLGLGDGGVLRSEGDLVIERSTFLDNVGGTGGVAFAHAGDITVTDSTFRSNRAESAGALRAETFFTGGDVTVLRSSFVSNEAQSFFAGAIFGNDVTVTDSLFDGNQAAVDGGAILAKSLDITNSTFVDNSATTGGALATEGIPHTVALDHVTMVDNTGDAQLSTGNDPIELTIGASVLTGSTPGCANLDTTTSTGHSIEAADTCGLDHSTDAVDSPQPVGTSLGRLRDNGGATASLYPLAGSDLVDAVPPGECTQAVDQRGVARPFGTGCDIGAVEQVYPEHAFTDVPAWVEDTVRWIGSTDNTPQIMTGITATTFEPNDPITRAQVTRLLYNEAGAPDVTATPAHPFTDVPAWVDDAVTWAYDEGIVTGITPTTFVPNDPITRAQVTRMKYRFAGSPDVSGIDPHPFTDVPAWVEDAVTWAANPDNALPLVTGITPTTFVPNDPITRAQVARMDHRLALTPAAWFDPDAAPSQMLFQGNLF